MKSGEIDEYTEQLYDVNSLKIGGYPDDGQDPELTRNLPPGAEVLDAITHVPLDKMVSTHLHACMLHARIRHACTLHVYMCVSECGEMVVCVLYAYLRVCIV